MLFYHRDNYITAINENTRKVIGILKYRTISRNVQLCQLINCNVALLITKISVKDVNVDKYLISELEKHSKYEDIPIIVIIPKNSQKLIDYFQNLGFAIKLVGNQYIGIYNRTPVNDMEEISTIGVITPYQKLH